MNSCDLPIEFYYWPTPNGFKVGIMLEELGAAYEVHPVDITKGQQFAAEFTRISPNQRIPAIVDPNVEGEAVTVFESGAILVYLAEKYGQFIPSDPGCRIACLEWLFWQVGGLGPMGGQAHHFRLYASEQIPYAIERYSNECRRLYGVMASRLAKYRYLAGDVYSIADMAALPWIYRHERQGIELTEFPQLHRWYLELLDRPTVFKGLNLEAALRDDNAFRSSEAQRNLFRNDTLDDQ